MTDLLTDSGVEIVAGLMVNVALSFETASLAFDEIIWCLSDIREAQGFKTTFQNIPNPRDYRLPPELQAQIKAEIEEKGSWVSVAEWRTALVWVCIFSG